MSESDSPRPKSSADLGARGQVFETSQLALGDLQRMSPSQIVQADKDGRLDRLLGRSRRDPRGGLRW